MSPALSAAVPLFAGLGAVLLLASTVGALLKHAVARGRPHAGIDNLVQRVNAWWVMVGAMGLAFVFGKTGVVLLFAGVSVAALREFVRVLDTGPADRPALAFGFLVVLPLQYGGVWMGWHGVMTAVVPLLVLLALPIVAAWTAGGTQRYLERVSRLQWGLLSCVFCISHVPALITLEPPAAGQEVHPLLLVAFLVIVVQGSDVLQYIFGKLVGRHPVAPVLSPSKTWEGLIGGVAGATALGAALHGLTPFAPLPAAGLACVLCVMGFLGGLVMSAIKRDRGIKDWGALIRGHGGVLDRVDSLVFAAPVCFHLVRWLS
jgi:phosphatidate cytidylyltransferase